MISPKEILTLFKQAVGAWKEDRAPSMGAALAYYTAFSIAPLLILVIGVAGLVFGRDVAQAAILDQIQGLLGADGGKAIDAMLTSAGDLGSGVLKTVVGVVMLLIGATTAFVELQDDLDRIWKAPPRVGSGIINLIRSRLLSIGMILGIGFLLTVSLVLSGAVSALGTYLFSGMEFLLQTANFVVSFGVITVLFAMIYKILPNVKIEWGDVWVGAGITALLFTIGKFLIGLYIGKSDVSSSFGAAGPFVVIMLWIFYSTQIFLLGAEFTNLHARRNSPQTAPAPAEAVAAAGNHPNPAANAPFVPVQHEAANATKSAVQIQPANLHPYRRVAISAAAGLAGGILLALLLPERQRSRSWKPRSALVNLAGLRNVAEKWRRQIRSTLKSWVR